MAKYVDLKIQYGKGETKYRSERLVSMSPLPCRASPRRSAARSFDEIGGGEKISVTRRRGDGGGGQRLTQDVDTASTLFSAGYTLSSVSSVLIGCQLRIYVKITSGAV